MTILTLILELMNTQFRNKKTQPVQLYHVWTQFERTVECKSWFKEHQLSFHNMFCVYNLKIVTGFKQQICNSTLTCPFRVRSFSHTVLKPEWNTSIGSSNARVDILRLKLTNLSLYWLCRLCKRTNETRVYNVITHTNMSVKYITFLIWQMYTHISFMNLLNEEFKLSFDIETTISHVYYPPSKWKVSYTVYDSVYTLISWLLLFLRAI